MCRTDLSTDNLLFPPSPLTYQRKLIQLPEKREEKCMFEKKKKSSVGTDRSTHVSSFISNVRFLESAHQNGVLKLSFSSVLWGQVLFGKPFDLSMIEGALKWNNYQQRGGKGRPGAAKETPDFHQLLAFLFEIFYLSTLVPHCFICLFLFNTLPFALILSVTDILNSIYVLKYYSAASLHHAPDYFNMF